MLNTHSKTLHQKTDLFALLTAYVAQELLLPKKACMLQRKFIKLYPYAAGG